MRLALRLGRTLSRLQHSLSANEAMIWMKFDRISPPGDKCGDTRNIQVVKAVFGAQGMNAALRGAMLCWDEDEDKPEVDPLAVLEDALNSAAQSWMMRAAEVVFLRPGKGEWRHYVN